MNEDSVRTILPALLLPCHKDKTENKRFSCKLTSWPNVICTKRPRCKTVVSDTLDW